MINKTTYNTCVVLENIHPPRQSVSWFERSHPCGNILLALFFPLKRLAFETLLLLGISNTLPSGGCVYFHELHII